ncbi:MAG: hypothetical protein U0939_12160 [Pirellulales bacterium]
MSRSPLIRLDTVVLVLFAISAWVSNPDENHLRRYVNRQVSAGQASLFERMATHATAKAVLSAVEVDRTNYGFFSIVRLGPPFEPQPIVGAFGIWIVIPKDKPAGSTSSAR